MREYIVDPQKMFDFTAQIFKAVGCNTEEAEAVAGQLVSADLRGVRSHGVIRIEKYLTKCVGGGHRKNAPIDIVMENPVVAVLDAHGAFGARASARAVEIAREKAKNFGIGYVIVRNSNHFGTAGHWALELAKEDMIGYCGSTTCANMIGPGMAEKAMGNNPFAMAFSGEKYKEICIDMACSVVAYGKAMDLQSRGLPIPFGWFIDKDGNPCNDLSKVTANLPFGGHKGFGVAFMIESMATLLAGGSITPDMHDQFEEDTSENASQFFMAIDVGSFRPLAEFKCDVDRYVDYHKSRRKAEGVDEIKYFGEIEYTNKLRISAEGITLPETLIEQFKGLAAEHSLPASATDFLTEKPKNQ